jgi:hypothetical protein
MESQPYEDENWATADQEAMTALDRDIMSSRVDDKEASMEEDIRGAADDVPRRNPQWTQQDVNQQIAEGAASNITSQTEATQNPMPYIRQSLPRRAAEEEAASFFRFSGGPFPSLFLSSVANRTDSTTDAAETDAPTDAVETDAPTDAVETDAPTEPAEPLGDTDSEDTDNATE